MAEQTAVERPAAPGKIQRGSEILFKVKRIHGYHGTVIDVTEDGVICRINEEALDGDIVVFPADQLVLIGNRSQLDVHHSDRLPWDYKS